MYHLGSVHIPQKQSTRSAGAERCSARNGSLLCWLIKLLAFLWTLHLSSTKTDNSRCCFIKSKPICDVWDLYFLYGYAVFSATVTLNTGGVMYLNTTVKIPEIKGKIIAKKKGTTAYILYQYGSEYHPEKQYSVPLRTIVGKMSSSDSTLMFPNERFQSYFPEVKLPEELPLAYRSCCLKIGSCVIIVSA